VPSAEGGTMVAVQNGTLTLTPDTLSLEFGGTVVASPSTRVMFNFAGMLDRAPTPMP
jgi:hypothetical protein